MAWLDDDASTFGAALAFYMVFSLAPALIVSLGVAGAAFGRKAVESELIYEMHALGGNIVATVIQTVIQSVNQPKLGVLATIIGLGTALIGASAAFFELQVVLNRIWKVQPRSEHFWLGAIKKRALSFGLVLATGCLLLVSVALSAGLDAAGKYLGSLLPTSAFFAESMHFLLSFAVVTFLFAMIYKILPDTEIHWQDVWVGAAVTALLFSIGKVLIGLYLGRSTMASAYGTAGSLVLVLAWVYYSAQVFLLGAEFTHVYSGRRDSRPKWISDSWAA